MKIKKVGSKSTYLIIIGVIIIIGLVFYFDKKNNTENTMPIATILMSLAATVTFLYTIEKNKESKEQFEQERNEVKAQFEEQQKFFQKQQFESTFFNMMKQLEDIVSKLSIDNVKGRDSFEHLYNKKTVIINDENYILEEVEPYLQYADDAIELDEFIVSNENPGVISITSDYGIKSILNGFGIFAYNYIG